LERILNVRKAALARFGEDAIRPGEPMSELEETLVPLYLLHRYQTEAAAKLIGGLDYRYAVRGDHAMITEMVAPEQQRKALAAVLQTLDPVTLTLSPEFLSALPPNPPGYPRTVEAFKGYTGLTFDPQGAVEAAANLSASLLFEPTRASRLVEYHARDPKSLSLGEVIDQTLQTTWEAPQQSGVLQQTQFSVDTVVLKHLMQLCVSKEASPQARAIALSKVSDLESWLSDQLDMYVSGGLEAHWSASLDDIERFWKEPEKFVIAPVLATPPGQPIGSEDDFQIE
jgi:Met-zincin